MFEFKSVLEFGKYYPQSPKNSHLDTIISIVFRNSRLALGFSALFYLLWIWVVGGIVLYATLAIRFLFPAQDKSRFGKTKRYFRVRDLKVSWQPSEKNSIEYVRIEQFTLEPLIDGIEYFTDTVIWDGTGTIEYSTSIPGHTVYERKFPAGYGYEVRFERTLNKGELVSVEVKCLMKDFGQTCSNMILKEIRYPTKKLTIEVTLPRNRHPNSVTYQVLSHVTSHTPYDKQGMPILKDDGRIQMRLVQNHPVILRCYGISWTTQSNE